ncbi:hypothetical protein KIW84_065262 [Lathyrus oleraceus]|uniref:Uncharacterized protein n=1 Tax=Pisum sativum TaxID=3888 RepID=A0A9D4WEX6_PEA|nr:hypothetical protein KIW84_065262 [Pisum sativum]
MSDWCFFCALAKLTHRYNTRANLLRIMEQENKELKDEIARLISMMESVLVAQSQYSPTPITPPARIVTSEVTTSTMPTATTHFAPNIPSGFPWGIPPNFVPEGFAPTFASMPASNPIMSVPPPVVHTLPRVEDTIYHSEPSEGPDVYEKMDEMKDHFLELHKELKTLRGELLSAQSSRDVRPKDKEESIVGKKVEVPVVDPVGCSKDKSGESSNLKTNDDDEVLRLIKRSEFNVVEQLLQTPSKISMLSLLMNSEAHREALQRVLEQAFVEHDVIVDQFDHIVANITSCNNLSFCDEELPKEGRNHNLALHISMNCKEDALSNVLVETGSSLNVLPKSTLSKLSYQGAPMRYSGVIVKPFDGSRKTVIGEVDLPVKIGPSDFHITFQVMDIHPAYSCLLGRAWIHEAGAVTSTLHQKLKFVKNGKLVIVGGEKALLVIHLSSFSYVKVEDEIGTPFQALSIAAEKSVAAPMSSLKDAQKIVEEGTVDQWGRMVEVSDNKGKTSLGFRQVEYPTLGKLIQKLGIVASNCTLLIFKVLKTCLSTRADTSSS